MRIKQFESVPSNQAVLAAHKHDLSRPCYDRKADGFNYAWVLIDGEGEADDHLELMEIAMDGTWDLCDRCFVVAKERCVICGQEMEPRYDSKQSPSQWQECRACGYVSYPVGGEDDGA